MFDGGFRPVIAIWGLGLIGGSLGMAWRRAGVAREVIGIGRPRSGADASATGGVAEPAGRTAVHPAVRLGAVDRLVTDPAEAIPQADVLVLATPVRVMIRQAAEYARLVRPGAVVTDVGSTKRAVVRVWEAHLPEGAAFVGGHPMFGRELGGVENASPELPAGAPYVLTPGQRATPEALALVQRLAEAAGCRVHVLSPAEHDRRVALISHLPQVAATALAAAALSGEEQAQGDGSPLTLAGGGFRDTTRLASSPADIWTDIFLTNSEAVLEAIRLFREELSALERAIREGDDGAIARIFERAHAARDRLNR